MLPWRYQVNSIGECGSERMSSASTAAFRRPLIRGRFRLITSWLQLVQPAAIDPPLAYKSLGIRAGESLPAALREVESATGVETVIPRDIHLGEDSDRW
jgi:hypothetical protein